MSKKDKKKEIDRRLRRLIDAAVTERLSETEQRELDELLRVNDGALRAYLEQCQLETDLYFHIHAMLAGRRVASGLASAQGRDASSHRKQAATEERPITQPSSVVRRMFANRSRAIAALAATLLCGFFAWWLAGYWHEIPAERQPQPVASLSEDDGAQWLGDSGPVVGQHFVEGDSLYLTKGRARISMASGAEIALRSPCFVTLAAANRVRLEEGALTVQVADWGHGFTVLTDGLRVVDLGTKFAVSTTNATGVSEAHVLDGQVRIQPLSDAALNRRSLLLSGGEAIRFETERKVTVRLKADRDLYDAEMDDIRPFKPIRTYNTGMGLVPGDEDPHWRITAGPKCQAFRGPEFAVVCEGDRRYLANDPNRSQWISVTNPCRPGVPPNTLFTFETTFDLTGYDLSTVTAAAQVIADNGIREVRVNGEPVPAATWNLNEPQQYFNKFEVVEIKRGFVPGVNRVEFDIWNGVDRYEPEAPNPVALRVEWQAFGRPLDTRLATSLVANEAIDQ